MHVYYLFCDVLRCISWSFLLSDILLSYIKYLSATYEMSQFCSVPDLDFTTPQKGDGPATSTNYNQSPSSPFDLADDERGVTVAIFNFLMVLFGLSRMNGSSQREAITAG